MIKFLILILIPIAIFADLHYAKLEPISSKVIKAEVLGVVTDVKSNLEGVLANGVVIHIDDQLDKEDLQSSMESLKLTNSMIKINKETLPLLKKSFLKKRDLYRKVAPLNSTSVSQKDTLYSAFVAAKSQYSGTLEKIMSLKSQKVTLNQKIAFLKDKIKKKSISVDNRYIYSLNIKSGEFVSIGMPLIEVSDISKGKLTLFLSEDELIDIDKKSIFIDGKKSDLKFSKIWKVADKKYISSYKAEIITKPFTRFSKLIKVEIK